MREKTAHKRVPRSQKDAGNGILVINSFQKKQNALKMWPKSLQKNVNCAEKSAKSCREKKAIGPKWCKIAPPRHEKS